MGKKSKKNVKSSSTKSSSSSNNNPPPQNNSIPRTQAPAAPGRKAIIRGLVSRKDLNGLEVTIQNALDNGRIAVEVVFGRDTIAERREVVAIKRENLETRWNCIGGIEAGSDMKHWGMTEEECPICMDVVMNIGLNKNAAYLECCGKSICEKCFVQTQFTKQKDVCPLCRADISDGSETAAIKRIRARAERGDANAMYNLGGYYDTGRPSIPKDQAMARVWFQRAAEKGESRGAYNLACSYRDGEGGAVDKAQAAKYFRMAGERGHIQGVTCYGLALMSGDGIKRDIVEGKKWLKKGADAGDELAVQQLQMHEMMASFGGMGMGNGNISCSSSPGMMSFSMG
mmetsp:Transcript_7420/g.15201  ORF Transcript_7420/g.15201 Transcript_7420/m.15201 type:complete len:342 (+) Transcript_7420:105-1130(+)